MDITSWKSQLRKGAAELAVLSAVENDRLFGLRILERIREGAGLEITEGTLYPLLNRLQRDGKIASEWVEDEGASHPRKYYHITQDGARLLQEMKKEWTGFARAINQLLAEDD